MLVAALFMGLLSQQWAMSQTDTNTAGVTTNEPVATQAAPASQPDAAIATTETTGAVVTAAAVVPAVSTNESSTTTSNTVTTDTTSVTTSTTNVTVDTTSVTTSNAPATTTVNTEVATGNTNETASATTPSTASTNTLPIQFQDVPLTTALENLTRLAGINYLLDPQIGYGQADQNGKIKTEPTLSVRWENVTARQALAAVLDNYGLQLVEDPKTQIARITIQNPNVPPPLVTRVIQLKYSSVSNMESAVGSSLPDKRSKVMSDSRTSQLVIVASEKEQDAVSMLIEQLDKPTRQVLIETRLKAVKL